MHVGLVMLGFPWSAAKTSDAAIVNLLGLGGLPNGAHMVDVTWMWSVCAREYVEGELSGWLLVRQVNHERSYIHITCI